MFTLDSEVAEKFTKQKFGEDFFGSLFSMSAQVQGAISQMETEFKEKQ